MKRVSLTLALVIVLIAWYPFAPVDRLHGQTRARVQTVAPKTTGAHRDWDNTVNRMLRTRELRVRFQRADTLIAGRTIERLDQYYGSVRVWGGELTRQLDSTGVAVSVFGTLYSDITVDPTPKLTQLNAKRTFYSAKP